MVGRGRRRTGRTETPYECFWTLKTFIKVDGRSYSLEDVQGRGTSKDSQGTQCQESCIHSNRSGP